MMFKLLYFHLTMLLITLIHCSELSGQFSPSAHRQPGPGEIPVSEAGSYAIPGATYVLVNDITSPRSAAVSYTHLRAHETVLDLVCRLLLEKKNFHIILYLLHVMDHL